MSLAASTRVDLATKPEFSAFSSAHMSKKKQKSTATREQDVENEMVKTGAAMS